MMIRFSGSVMIWVCMAWEATDGLELIVNIITEEVYENILRPNINYPVQKLRLRKKFIFQKIPDPNHTSKLLVKYFQKTKIHVFDWPPQFQDPNSFEHIWGNLKR